MIRKNNRKLYESIIKDVARTIKKNLNENLNNAKCFLIVTYYFNSNNSENCYSNPNADINHTSLANDAKLIIQNYIYDKYNSKNEIIKQLNLVHEGHESTLEIGYEWYQMDDIFSDISELFNELMELNNNENVLIEYKTSNNYITN